MKDLTGNADITLKQVHDQFGTTLVVAVWNNSTSKVMYLSHENYPDLQVKKAVRMSMSIPYFFTSCWLTVDGKRCEIQDGGVSANYPTKVFDDHKYCSKETVANLVTRSVVTADEKGDYTFKEDPFVNPELIGFKVDTVEEIRSGDNTWKDTSSLRNSIKNLIAGIYSTAQKVHRSSTDHSRTVRINCGNSSSLDFKMDEAEKTRLVDAGYSATIAYLDALEGRA